jgi:deoxyribonuclease-4
MAKPLGQNDVELFKSKLAGSKIETDSVIVHMPYLPNLSGPASDFYTKSVLTLCEEMHRCISLEIRYLVIHLGSHMGKGTTQGIAQLVNAIRTAIESADRVRTRNKVMILLENNAGQKNAVGANFQELATILEKTSSKRGEVAICLDTCHLYASGYDIRSLSGVTDTLEKFDKIVGISRLKLIHLNDSKGELGSNLDRHQHIGLGHIGLDGLSTVINNEEIKKLPLIMETPIDSQRGDEENMNVALGLIK